MLLGVFNLVDLAGRSSVSVVKRKTVCSPHRAKEMLKIKSFRLGGDSKAETRAANRLPLLMTIFSLFSNCGCVLVEQRDGQRFFNGKKFAE